MEYAFHQNFFFISHENFEQFAEELGYHFQRYGKISDRALRRKLHRHLMPDSDLNEACMFMETLLKVEKNKYRHKTFYDETSRFDLYHHPFEEVPEKCNSTNSTTRLYFGRIPSDLYVSESWGEGKKERRRELESSISSS
ncbi:MAG: hypothetical protein ACOCXG_00790 [Nanoarchaeota archaeon]